MLIGKKIKEIRTAKNISLSDLAKRSGVQIATLSRIENLKMVGTIESHMNIARALGIEFTEFYQNASPAKPINREASPASPPAAPESFTYNNAASYEILTNSILSKKMMPIVLRIEPNGKSNPEQNAKGSERFIFVLEGEIVVHVSDKEYALTPTNTLYFNAAEKHYFENRGTVTARAIVVTTPVTL